MTSHNTTRTRARVVCAIVLSWLFNVQSSSAGIIYVDADAIGGNSGSSWSNAYTSLQTALSVVGGGDEIWIAEGTYKPGVTSTDTFQLQADVSLYGGFTGTESLRSQRNWTNYVTILSGDIGTLGDPRDNTYHVLKGANGAILDGFTVTAGRGGTNWPAVSGAGLFNSNASPVIANCRFTDNAAYFAAGSGGAIFNLHSSPTITNCTFTGNSAYWGGAICNLSGGTATVVNCEFTGNSADIGGAVNNESTAAILRDCRFTENTGDGGGVNNRGCAPLLLNCVFAQNNARLWDAGGLRNVAASPCVPTALFVENYTMEGNGASAYSFKGAPQYVNCTFYGNRAELGTGGAIFNDNVTGATLKNCILWSNVAGAAGAEVFNTGGTFAVSFSDIEGGLNGGKCGGIASVNGGGNLAVWPLFVNVSDLDGPDNRYATADDGLQLNALLSGVSPCIDSGTPGSAPGCDLVNLARPKQYGFDMGAYEYNPDYDGDGLDNLLEYRIGSNANSSDSDGDGITDGIEYYIYGTSPILRDTDGDGMTDEWEIACGLNPFVNDAGQDRDLDWLTNLQECQSTNNPSLADSNADGTNDFATVNGKSGARYTYDRIDRLTGVEYERGFSIAYVYDGNGNLLRQFYLQRDEDGDGVPDLWEFQNGLSWTNATSHGGTYGDSDGDGWSNYQEWQAGTRPDKATEKPDILGVSGTTAGIYSCNFTPSNFVVGVGQLDGVGAEEIIVGADGNPCGLTNSLMILTQTTEGWSTQKVSIGAVGVTSIAVGQPANISSPAIYIGTRQIDGTGTVKQVIATTNGWAVTTVCVSSGDVAYVLGVRSNADLLAQLSVTNGADQGLVSASMASGGWRVGLLDGRSSHRGLAFLAKTTTNAAPLSPVRLLDEGGIQVGVDTIGTTSTYFQISGSLTWAEAEAAAELQGGHLATINDEAENSLLTYLWFYRL